MKSGLVKKSSFRSTVLFNVPLECLQLWVRSESCWQCHFAFFRAGRVTVACHLFCSHRGIVLPWVLPVQLKVRIHVGIKKKKKKKKRKKGSSFGFLCILEFLVWLWSPTARLFFFFPPSCPGIFALAVTRSSEFIVSLGFVYHTCLAWYPRETFQVLLEALCSAFLSYHNVLRQMMGFGK